tara:strand:+ start:589 stop:1686 length:1098 start_codon:yes stop_codon:yes gene_type:complete
MNDSVISFVNAGIESLQPYEPGRSIEEVVLDYNPKKIVKLASNENPLGPSPKAKKILKSLNESLNLYPSSDATSLKNKIAKLESVKNDQIIIGNGSNEVLELAARAFLNNTSNAVMSKHAFAVYKILTQACGSKAIEVPMINWTHDLQHFNDYCDHETRMIFVANPNNPTGTFNTHSDFRDMMLELPKSILVVLDLAYYEYVEVEDYIRTNELLNEFDNILITKTFSKIQGLASLRIGYGIGSKELCSVINKIRQPFNVNQLAQLAAIEAIDDIDHIKQSRDLNSTERARMMIALESIGMECIKSQGNFISFKGHFNSEEMFLSLMKLGVIVRPIDNYEMLGYLRITIGTPEENDYFFNHFKTLL